MQNVRAAFRLVAVGFAVMSLAGFFRYTSVGIDSDRAERRTIRHRYYRIQWPGDGTFRLCSGTVRYPCDPAACHSDPFDPAGRFFLPPKRERPRNLWNHLGFWYYNNPLVFTLGVPALLPTVLLLLAFAPKTRYRIPEHKRSV